MTLKNKYCRQDVHLRVFFGVCSKIYSYQNENGALRHRPILFHDKSFLQSITVNKILSISGIDPNSDVEELAHISALVNDFESY
jgi:hypothetical protein